jgi:hypothetical protein
MANLMTESAASIARSEEIGGAPTGTLIHTQSTRPSQMPKHQMRRIWIGDWMVANYYSLANT